MISNQELILRIVLSAIIGGIIGLERESGNRAAGFRTHILVTMGSALIMLISIQVGIKYNSDPARLAAQVVSGIGFLGAGTILRNGNTVIGLTTAASLWVCGGLGIAIGGGYYAEGLVAAGITFISLGYLSKVEGTISKRNKRITLLCEERADLLENLANVFSKNNIKIKDLRIIRDKQEYEYSTLGGSSNMFLDEDTIGIECTLVHNKQLDIVKFQMELSKVQGVKQIKFLS